MKVDNLRVLIIDDSPEDREIMQRLLNKGAQQPFRFDSAETGAAGLRACLDNEAGLPDCILLDYHLPDYEAPQFLMALGDLQLLACPVVVITGIADGLDGRQLLQLGAQDFISKKWMNSESLARTVENAVERHRLHHALRDNEQHLLAILNLSPIAIRITHLQGNKIAYANSAYNTLFKDFTPKHGNPSAYYAQQEDYQAIQAALNNGYSITSRPVKFFNPENSASIWTLASYMPIQFHGQEAKLAWFYDITELMAMRENLSRQLAYQQQVEETLRQANAEEHAIFDSATSGIVLVKDNLIQRCNRQLEEIFGYAPGELLGQSMQVWYPDQSAFETGVLPVYREIEAGKFHRLEQQLIRKDGNLFWARFSGKALYSEAPENGWVGIIDDITLERQNTDALISAKQLAEQMTQVKSDFLANMSHEIRTPMNGVLGMMDLLRESKLTPSQRDWLDIAYNSGEVLLEIINEILDLSKLEESKFELQQLDFNLIDLVKDVCALLTHQAHAKGLALHYLAAISVPPRWRGDALRIRQVLTNLIGNAIKFTQQGEVSVRISLSSVAEGTEGADDGAALRFEVQDSGIGIAAKTLPLLFKPFSQADSTTSRHFGGSGLGLSISKKLVELMGGTIGVNSHPGQGSCFWFTLPLTQSAANFSSTPAYNLAGKRALIVDDNATNRKTLSTLVGLWGLEVSEANNGSAALLHLQSAALQGLSYDLMLLDRHVPEMGGLTLAKHLARLPASAKLPIILLSSSDNLLDQAELQGTGIVQCLLKPVRKMQLYEAVVHAMPGVASAAEGTAAQENQPPSYAGHKVLVVEDNIINQKVIFAKLARFDIVAELAANGQLALDKLAQGRYDLIFMDCHMPVMDGYDATRALRQMESRTGLPHQIVVALTANALEGERDKCLAAGMDDYLTKPIVSEQLAALLAERLGVPRPTPLAH